MHYIVVHKIKNQVSQGQLNSLELRTMYLTNKIKI